MITLNQTENDDPLFIGLATQLLNGAMLCYMPNEIYLVQIDSWFDHKWQSFSGVINLQLGVWNSDMLRVPPFNPNRVVTELHFRVDETSPSKYILHPAQPLHISQWSVSNLQRRLKQMTVSGLYIWYSGNTKKNGRGSLMLYNIEKENQLSWYVSFAKSDEWRINKVKGISKRELIDFIKMSDAMHGV